MDPVAGIAASGLAAATLRLSVSASNLANIENIAPICAAAYQPQGVETTPLPGGGVAAAAVTLKPASQPAYDPTSPMANGQGLVSMPEIDPVTEITNQLQAGQAYAFQLKTLQVADQEDKSLFDMTA